MNNNLLTVKGLVERPGYEWLTERGLRHLIFNAQTNGLKESGALIKLSRRVLIDQPRFDSWVANHRVY